MNGREGLTRMSDRRSAVTRWWRAKPADVSARRLRTPAPLIRGLRRTSPAWSTRLDEVLAFNASH
ncbi:hypothetical protein VSH64_07385 [Amycolatopsis rhabdoformis]|uniref:Uncharacterized protein n=1 Tax=Amycolatopsis rhabdoformis TaxID=1448059 RepID=A0ABZ1IDV4_9PSEU|nr:hypothetical protein [Amycolatopsis rhabdoformis]WSE31931.1 hypothetical protein VSH64_07385 [Amycolatopsis rhabdoformis]